MKKKILTLLPIVLLIAVATGYFTLIPRTFTGTIVSVQQAEIGELVSITASDADDYKWQILPKTDSFKLIQDGKTLIFSASKTGTYLFICAMAKNGKVELVIHKLVVGTPTPDEPIDTFTGLIKSWTPKDTNKSELERVAYSFDMIATSGQTDVGNFIKLTALSNRAALGGDIERWKPFLKNVSEYCKVNLKDKPIEDHVQLWLKISAALRK